MHDFTVLMALVDYIPVVLFAIAATILSSDLYNKMDKGSFALFSSGLINITVAGTLKATWKLLYAANICDFEAFNNIFFPLQSIGFLLAGIGILSMMIKKKNTGVFSAAPPVFSGTAVFITFMVLGLAVINTVLSILAFKMKKRALTFIFVLSFLCSLAMGYLSSQNYSEAAMNWIAETVNILGQGSFLAGVIMLRKNNLKHFSLT